MLYENLQINCKIIQTFINTKYPYCWEFKFLFLFWNFIWVTFYHFFSFSFTFNDLNWKEFYAKKIFAEIFSMVKGYVISFVWLFLNRFLFLYLYTGTLKHFKKNDIQSLIWQVRGSKKGFCIVKSLWQINWCNENIMILPFISSVLFLQ